MEHSVLAPARLAILFLTALLALTAACAQASAADAPPAPLSQAMGPASAPADTDAAIGEVLRRYARGWYEGNASLVAATLHPEFTRTAIRRTAALPDAVEVASGLALLDLTDRGFGNQTQPGARKSAVAEIQVHGGCASAVLTLSDRVELVQLARWNNQWRIVHVLSENNA